MPVLIGKYKGISKEEYILNAVYCLPGLPDPGSRPVKASSSLTILQKKALQKLGPLSFFLKPRLNFKWELQGGARR